MLKRLLLVLAVSALAVAGAKTYSVTLYRASVLAGTQLKPGEYQLNLTDTKAVLKGGKVAVESAVKVEKASSKFSGTSVRYADGEGPLRVQEIRLGGTNLRLVFD